MDLFSTKPTPPPLPVDLPVPVDDGGASHLPGLRIPEISLASTDGGEIHLADLAAEGLVLYVFPKLGRPDQADPPGWDDVPGARGCTQQSCAFRDLHREFANLGYSVAGLSAQPPEEQEEASLRLQLAFPLLADPGRRLADALALPTFRIAGMTLYRRSTLVTRGRRIAKVFYPVFPPDENAEQVLRWIRSNPEAD
jgi:peroxiredoxin